MNFKQQNSKLAADLEELINRALDTSYFPYVRGKSVRIRHIIVREARFGFLVFDTKLNKEIAKMFCKTSALALAKQFAKRYDVSKLKIIKELDIVIEKNYNDALFFKNIMKNAKDIDRRCIAETRYELAVAKTREAKEKLDSYIYY